MPMDRKEKAKIEAHMEGIVGNFDVTDILTDLVGNGLTLETKREIDKVEIIRNKNRKCLECLMKSESGSYDVFIKLLRKANYANIVDKLESGLPPGDETGKAAAAEVIHVPENKRHLHLDDRQLMRFSSAVSPKDKIEWVACLGLSGHVDDIEMDNPHSRTEMMKILFRWRVISERDATLGGLMAKFNQSLENGVYIDVDKVRGIISTEIQEK